jgi:hypothetical protein
VRGAWMAPLIHKIRSPMMDESSFVKTPLGAQLQPIKEPTEEVVMTTVRSNAPRDPSQTDLIRYFDRNLVTTDTVRSIDRFAIEAKARHDRAAVMGEMIGSGIAWLWQRARHSGETRSPSPRLYLAGRI